MTARMAFRLVTIGLAVCGTVASAQEVETIYRTEVDPNSGRRERVIDVWATGQAEQAARDKSFEDQQRQTSNSNRAQADYENNRNQQQRDGLRALSNTIYASNVDLITRRHQKGIAVIKSGKARTSFAPQPGFSITAYLGKRYPAASGLIASLAQPASTRFNAGLVAKGLSKTDLADGQALAFVTAYEAYSGQTTGPAHLAFARQTVRSKILKSSIDQGADDAERQKDFEHFGVLAFVAKDLQARGDPMGKEMAGAVLQALGQTAASSIAMTASGFTHRGQQIIASGRASTLFRPGPSLTPQIYAKQFSGEYVARSTFENNARQAISAFYGEMARRGGRANDLASIVSFLMAANASAISGQEPNPAQIQSAYDVARNAILRSPDIQAAPDAEKQVAVELMMFRSIEALRERNAPVARANLQKIFQALGEDPNNYDLTPTGLRRKS